MIYPYINNAPYTPKHAPTSPLWYIRNHGLFGA